MKWFSKIMMLSFIVFVFSCEEESTTGSNGLLGGDTDIDLTEPGGEFGVYIEMDGVDNSAFDAISDDVTILTRDNGIVTLSAKFSTNEENLKKIDTLLGIQDVGEPLKHQVVDHYLDLTGAVLDTSDKQNITLEVVFKGRVTSKGIQDFVLSGGDESKPFTLVRYDSKVGDKYTFEKEDGTVIEREVTYKSSTDEYEMGFLLIKVIKVVEKSEDPLVDNITYITNHKFGLVGVEIRMVNGTVVKSTIIPWNVV